MNRLNGKVALITGASSGIGRSVALQLAEQGCALALGARRIDRLEELASGISMQGGVKVFHGALDVRSTESVNRFVAAAHTDLGRIDILVNSAGLALGMDPVDVTVDSDFEQVIDTNVKGVLRVTRAVLPLMLNQTGGGHVIQLGSIAGQIGYANGSVYCASKHALRALTASLRQEVHGKPIRVSSVDPGMVETEFSEVRFHGDQARAKKVYEGMTPLTADDIAEIVVFIASRPPHVDIDQVMVNPTDQAGLKAFRRT